MKIEPIKEGRQSLPKRYVRRLWRAIVEFELLKPGDRILVGFSGGKDSAFLLYALSVIRNSGPIPFDLAAITVDLGFDEPFDRDRLHEFCTRLDVPFNIEMTQISRAALSPESKQNPCSLCAHLRRGAINGFAKTQGYNKVALAHHHDDAVVTFLMSIIYSGQIQTFTPSTYLSDTGLTVIRPLVYFREYEIQKAVALTGFKPLMSPCPVTRVNKRREISDLIRDLMRKDASIYQKLSRAIRRDAVKELWPPVPSREQMRLLHLKLFGTL